MTNKCPLGLQRAKPTAASKAVSRLVDSPMSHVEVVRAMTGGNNPNRNKIARAYAALQASLADVKWANDLVELRLAEYCEVLDQELERLTP
jgi:hypothetical protein